MAQNLKNKKDHLQDLGIDLENNIKMDREGMAVVIWIRIGTVCRP